MNFEEFLTGEQSAAGEEKETALEETKAEMASSPEEISDHPIELDVQKAVVESLAADKAQQDEVIDNLRQDNYRLTQELSALKLRLADAEEALAKTGEILAKNDERAEESSNRLALLEKNLDFPDKFEGEARDHVLEVLVSARVQAESEGRYRKAKLLEAVLAANEPNGKLAANRAWLKKLFEQNGNIVNGPVLEELKKLGIPHKHGEDYLLPSEIINRVY